MLRHIIQNPANGKKLEVSEFALKRNPRYAGWTIIETMGKPVATRTQHVPLPLGPGAVPPEVLAAKAKQRPESVAVASDPLTGPDEPGPPPPVGDETPATPKRGRPAKVK